MQDIFAKAIVLGSEFVVSDMNLVCPKPSKWILTCPSLYSQQRLCLQHAGKVTSFTLLKLHVGVDAKQLSLCLFSDEMVEHICFVSSIDTAHSRTNWLLESLM